MFNVIDTASGWKADLIVRKDRPFSEEANSPPAIGAGFLGTPLPVVSAEDSILSKLELIEGRTVGTAVPVTRYGVALVRYGRIGP